MSETTIQTTEMSVVDHGGAFARLADVSDGVAIERRFRDFVDGASMTTEVGMAEFQRTMFAHLGTGVSITAYTESAPSVDDVVVVVVSACEWSEVYVIPVAEVI